jgi:NAD(P)-dependent dehydrogenase (short-subunit alcohol dehydrogenase family)
MQETVVITGAGGMGLACARRLGSGRQLLVGDFDPARLAALADELSKDGYNVVTRQLDVSDADSVAAFAAAVKGPCRAVVHTAGLSPGMAKADRIFAVDLLGSALILDAFLPLAVAGTVAVVISSMAAFAMPLPADLERQLALAPTSELIGLFANMPQAQNAQFAYCSSKRGNQLRVEAASVAWGKRGARVVSISPGIISTPMGRMELGQPVVVQLLETTPVSRAGTPEDIAAAVAWLVSPEASFISGTDLRVDGGSTASQRWRTA